MIKIVITILSKLNLENFKLYLKFKIFKFLLAYIFVQIFNFEPQFLQNFQIDPIDFKITNHL